MAIDHDEKVRLLVRLCRELAGLGLHAVMSDARPALSVRAGLAEPRLWVWVSPGGEFFEWCARTGGPLPAADPQRAAARIADYVRTHVTG